MRRNLCELAYRCPPRMTCNHRLPRWCVSSTDYILGEVCLSAVELSTKMTTVGRFTLQINGSKNLLHFHYVNIIQVHLKILRDLYKTPSSNLLLKVGTFPMKPAVSILPIPRRIKSALVVLHLQSTREHQASFASTGWYSSWLLFLSPPSLALNLQPKRVPMCHRVFLEGRKR